MIWDSRTIKLIGVTVDNELKIDEYINNFGMKAQRKLSYNKNKKNFHCRNTSKKINKLHEVALRLVYDDYTLKFEESLEKDESFTVHYYNMQTVYIVLYKVYNNLSQAIFIDLFVKNHINYHLHSQLIFLSRKLNCS